MTGQGEAQADILARQMERENVLWRKGTRYYADEFSDVVTSDGTIYARLRPASLFDHLIPDLSNSHVDTSDIPF